MSYGTKPYGKESTQSRKYGTDPDMLIEPMPEPIVTPKSKIVTPKPKPVKK